MDTIDERTVLVASSVRLPGRKRSNLRNPYEDIDKRGFVGRKDFRKQKSKVQRLGSKTKRSWGLRMPKIRIRIISPLTLLARLRDAYVKMMVNFASSRNVVGLAMGPLSGGVKTGFNNPGRKIDSNQYIFNDAELMCIEYMKRDPAFMRSMLS